MTFITVLSYYLMTGSLLGAVAAIRSKNKGTAWAEYRYAKNSTYGLSKQDIIQLYPLFVLTAFTIFWPFGLITFLKILFGFKLKWEQ